jgi:hypothetical protein
MGILEQIQQLKERGIPENQIIANLKEQNYPPKQISDALNQFQIKNDVTNQEIYAPTPDNNMHQSIMQDNSEFNAPIPENMQKANYQDNSNNNYENQRQASEFPNYEEYSPQFESDSSLQYPQDFNQSNESYMPQFPENQQEHYSPYSESQQGLNQNQYSSTSTDVIIDISEQVFEEKISELKKDLREVSELKALAEVRIKNIDKRLEKIESIIDKLQITILEKIGSYGNNIHSIKEEMNMMQDSFGKMINPLKEIAEKTHHASTHHNLTQHHKISSSSTKHKKHKSHSKKK